MIFTPVATVVRAIDEARAALLDLRDTLRRAIDRERQERESEQDWQPDDLPTEPL